MSKVVNCARHWLGTPYRHQASVRGAGCDCLGFIRGIWRETVGPEPWELPAYRRDWSAETKEKALFRHCASYLRAKDYSVEAEGDVILFRMHADAPVLHLGIQSAIGSAARFLHAYDRHGVVESPLSPPWRRKLVARFSFPSEAK